MNVVFLYKKWSNAVVMKEQITLVYQCHMCGFFSTGEYFAANIERTLNNITLAQLNTENICYISHDLRLQRHFTSPTQTLPLVSELTHGDHSPDLTTVAGLFQ